jgi:hypothetical protein
MHWTQSFTPGPGGVMTDDVGTVTGALVLRTEVDEGGAARLRVQYDGATEWYDVSHGHFDLGDADPKAKGEALHDEAVGILARGGADLSKAEFSSLR